MSIIGIIYVQFVRCYTLSFLNKSNHMIAFALTAITQKVVIFPQG